jgi:hypothetical protein
MEGTIFQKRPHAFEEGVSASRYNFDPIGRSGNLMVARADYMHPAHADGSHARRSDRQATLEGLKTTGAHGKRAREF